MNDRFSPIAVGKVFPAPTHIPAPRAQRLDVALALPCYEGMDDAADYAQTLVEVSPLLLSTPALLAEVDALALRVARCETRARDVALVHQLAVRLRAASIAAPVRGREALEGMLLVDIADERDTAAPALTFARAA